jgi:hypothetical protein
MTTVLPTLLNNVDAAAAIGVTPKTLNFWRHKGRGPRFIKFGPSKSAGVAYDPADIEAWKRERTFASTSAVSAAARGPAPKLAAAPAAPSKVVTPPWQSAV